MYRLMRRHAIVFRRTFFWAFLIYLPIPLFMATQGAALAMGAVAGIALALLPLQEGLVQPGTEVFLLCLPVSRTQVVLETFLSSTLLMALGQALFLLPALGAHALLPHRFPALEPGTPAQAFTLFLALCLLLFPLLTLRFLLRGRGVILFGVALGAGILWQVVDGFRWAQARVGEAQDHPLAAALALAALLALGLAVSVKAQGRREW